MRSETPRSPVTRRQPPIRPAVRRHAMRGVTFIELIVTVSLLTILLTLGVSGMSQLVAENRRVTEVNNLVGALNFARAEAVLRNGYVGVCALDRSKLDGTGYPCRAAANGKYPWHDGYVVFVDDAVRTRLRVYERTGSVRMESPGPDPSVGVAAPGFFFDPNGLARDSSGYRRNETIIVCDQRDNSSSDPRPAGIVPPRIVVVSNVGRIRVSDEKDGAAINCATPEDDSAADEDDGADADASGDAARADTSSGSGSG